MSAGTTIPPQLIDSLRRWQALRKRGWTLMEVAALQPDLARAAELALAAGQETIALAVRDFALYLGSLVDGAVSEPTAVQRKRLIELEEAAVAPLRAARQAQASAAPETQIVALAGESALWETIAEALAGSDLSLRRTDQPARFLTWLGSKALLAVIVDGEHLMDLGSVADRIESRRSKDRLGPTVVFLNRGRQLDQRLLALASGADACLEGDDSSYVIARILELVEAQTRQEHLKVLIVEDDRSQAMYCEAILRKQGIEVCSVGDSCQALPTLTDFQPDLVLMDLHMPTLDGMQLTALIREDPALAMLPIVFLTGEQDEGRRFDALRVGGDDYLTKPVRPRHLVTAVVTRARRARALRRQFEQHVRRAPERRLHTGEFIAHMRAQEQHASAQTLVLVAADDGRVAPAKAHPLVEREQESNIARSLAEALAPNERLAVWRDGGFLALLGDIPGEESDRRAEGLRQRLASSLDGASASAAVVPYQQESTSVEAVIDLAERTLVLARHGGGDRMQRALTELRTELDADASFVLQKALARTAADEQLQFEFQPIVPLHGAVRPQFQLHLRVIGENGQSFTRRQWLDVARQSGSLTKLDRYLLTQTLDRVTDLRARYPSVRLVVAMAAESLIAADFRKSLLFGLSQRGLLEPGLILTVDESEALLHLRPLQQARLELAAARVGIGLARTSIHPRAHQLIDALKPEWVALDAPKMLVDPEAVAVINHAHERGAEVVAHFIPDAPAMARLFALGVDYGIGSFIGPPSAEAEFDFGA